MDWLDSLDNTGYENLSKLSLALLICSQICRERNQVVFRNEKAMPNRVFMLTLSMRKDYLKANSTSKKLQQNIRWKPPQMGLLKINFDGSVVNSKAAAGFIIRGEEGTPIVSRARFLGEG